ncbi:MAG: hypothetical protein LBJ67_15365, partial [Planctomycetaceae bacterium]|nr:hypothetical protein [Planctomycetaceae bacterium]
MFPPWAVCRVFDSSRSTSPTQRSTPPPQHSCFAVNSKRPNKPLIRPLYHPWLLTVTFQIMSIGYNIDVVFRIFHFYQGGYHASPR